jgi:hypothetical protein
MIAAFLFACLAWGAFLIVIRPFVLWYFKINERLELERKLLDATQRAATAIEAAFPEKGN